MADSPSETARRPRRTSPAASRDALQPPLAQRQTVATRWHGTTLRDDYAWLRADNWREVLRDPARLPPHIRAHLEAENRYADAVLGKARRLQRRLVEEMRGRITESDASVPVDDGPWSYFDRYRRNGEFPAICRRPRDGGRTQVMLDGDRLAAGKAYFDIIETSHSPDHALLAWSTDETGSEFSTILVRDLATGKDLDDRIVDTDGGAIWTSDSRAFYYVRLDENCRPTRVYRHRLGQDQSRDELVFEEKSPRWHLDLDETQSQRFAVISISDQETSEAWLLDLRKQRARPRLVEPRRRKVRYDVEHHGARLFILTNADRAEDFKIVSAPLGDPSRANWREFIPHRRGCMITGMAVFKRYLVRTELEDGLPRIIVRNIRSGEEYAIEFDEEAYDLDLDEVLEYDTDTIRFAYSSLTTPDEIYDFDMATRRRRLRKRRKIPSGHDPARYVARRLFATGHDGAQIPVSVLHARKTPLDGSAPLLLSAYGAYGHTSDAAFGAQRFSLVDRGFVYAIAHVRGGADKGWGWYRQGKLQEKKNTFLDFIAAGKCLAAQGYTHEGGIIGVGASAGGLLIGAVANMAPELFAGLIADVPFVDVLNTMTDADLPLTPPEWREWGNPVRSKAAFEYLQSYSPYDNVRAQHYPAMLVLTGLSDPRVTYWEPAKWVAKLRANMSGGGPILLRTNMDAGHGGPPGRFEQLPQRALEYAFAILCAQDKL